MAETFSARETQRRPAGTSTVPQRAASSSARWMCGASSAAPSQAAP